MARQCLLLAISRSGGDVEKLVFTVPRAEPDAENPQVGFDERGSKTERCSTVQATARFLDSISATRDPFLIPSTEPYAPAREKFRGQNDGRCAGF